MKLLARMKSCHCAMAWKGLGVVTLSALTIGVVSPALADVEIPFKKTVLKNGMTVILHEDHSLPIVVVNVSYNVGSRYEVKGRTGFAHLFEHLMFMGTKNAPTKTFDEWMEAAGGWNNAWTSEDRTDYFDVGPTTSLPLLMWLEADRLRDLSASMTLDKLNAQREVVKNERRQTSENTPYGGAQLRLPELLYPAEHPYHHPVIGSHEDLEAATVDDVKAFFSTWYDPSNASIVVAGDIDPAATLAKLQPLFEAIPSRGKPSDPGAPGFSSEKTTITKSVLETLEDRVKLSKTFVAWQSPKHFTPADAHLDLLATVLSSKSGRLYKALVYDQKIAQSVEASQDSGTLGSRFVISVAARPGVSLERVEAALDRELEKVRAQPLTAEELTRAKNGYESSFVRRLESVKERASILNAYQAELGDPGFLLRDLERYRTATSEDVRKIAAQVLDPGRRVVLRVVPAKEAK